MQQEFWCQPSETENRTIECELNKTNFTVIVTTDYILSFSHWLGIHTGLFEIIRIMSA